MDESEDRSLIEGVIRQRIEGIRLRDPQMIRNVIDVDSYTKFDDWPPGRLLQGEAALESEKAAMAVLDEYRYSINDLMVNVKGNIAWASLYLQYAGAIRKRGFDVRSRVSMILAKSGDGWRIVHEHFSTVPQQFPLVTTSPKPPEEKPKIAEPREDEVGAAVLKILGDGVERTAAALAREVSKALGREVMTPQVAEKCRELVARGMLESHGRLYPRYRLKS